MSELFLFIPFTVILHALLSAINQKLLFFKTGQALLFYLFFAINIIFFLTYINFYNNNKSFNFIYFFLVINLFYYCYFHFYNMSETARRIKILIMIKTQNVASPNDLFVNYSNETQIMNRLDRLVDMNQIVLKGKYYHLNGRVLIYIARAFIAIKKFFLGSA